MRPYVLLASRSEDAAADEEYASILRLAGLGEDDLVRVRMESGAFTPLALEDFSGVILGGSPFTASLPPAHKSDMQLRVEAELTGLLADVLAGDVPFLGLCYGVGCLGRHAGGVVDGTYAEETGATTIELTDAGRADPLLAGLPETFTAYVGHKEACTVLPAGAVALATSAPCPVQMFRLGERQYVTQFHPEMDEAAIVTRIRTYQHSGYFPADQVEAVLARVAGVDVSHSHRILPAFVERFARD
ncbi:glutamine amidotransferase [Georgenia faecalis]|uniref:Glutamine amidotransferase n=1 Tax=Georgenia faecalis TaxID=2483799 RepID=A0ABV9DDP4_9MICO|nr:glutamine amidotransferase [Georgenia faecalis]